MQIKPQSEFKYIDRYRAKFAVTDTTIFAYDNTIYTNYKLPEHLIIHESTHFKQQAVYGLEEWVNKYLDDPQFRLVQEIEAYKNQIASIKDRNQRFKLMLVCAQHLSSDLYANIITYNEALKLLK